MNSVLLIGESVGWQELILIGILALIIFGPRKLPELGRKFGKIMAELRRATTEFKSTWEEEVSAITKDFKEELKDVDNDVRMLAVLDAPKPVENSIGRNQMLDDGTIETQNGNSTNGNQIEMPTVKEVEPSQINQPEGTAATAEIAEVKAAETKKDWL